MAITLTYEPVYNGIEITATALAAADVALVQRSTDQVTWTTVRGASAWPVAAGAFVSTLTDYEFVPGVVNYYRVRGVVTAATTFVAAGAAATANNASVTPALPAGLVVGDLVVAWASIRNSGTGTVDTPAGWTQIVASGNTALLGRIYDGVFAAPVITFTGGVANSDTIGQCAAFRGADILAHTTNAQLNASAQDVSYPLATITADGCVVLYLAWKQDDWTSVATLAGAAEIGEATSTAGDDAGNVWDYIIQTTATSVAAGSFVVTGGTAQISRGLVVALPEAAFLNEQTTTITQNIDSVWIKSVTRPFLNRAVTTVQKPPNTYSRATRSKTFDIIGRSFPIAVTDVRSGKSWPMYVRTENQVDTQTMEYVIASGDVLYIQIPYGWPLGGGYVAVGDVDESWHPLRPTRVTFTLPLTEVAPPGPYVVAASSTWATVLAGYATWADVIATFPTWADLLAAKGAWSEVIVP